MGSKLSKRISNVPTKCHICDSDKLIVKSFHNMSSCNCNPPCNCKWEYKTSYECEKGHVINKYEYC